MSTKLCEKGKSQKAKLETKIMFFLLCFCFIIRHKSKWLVYRYFHQVSVVPRLNMFCILNTKWVFKYRYLNNNYIMFPFKSWYCAKTKDGTVNGKNLGEYLCMKVALQVPQFLLLLFFASADAERCVRHILEDSQLDFFGLYLLSES